MNFNGIIIGAAVFLSIGICHPLVIKMEYQWGKQSWWIWLVAGLAFSALSLFIKNDGELVMTVPFTVNDSVKTDEKIAFTVSNVHATTGYTGSEKKLTFVFEDGGEITVPGDRMTPGRIHGGFFNIELEMTTKH